MVEEIANRGTEGKYRRGAFMRHADVMRVDIVAFNALGVVLKDLECIGNRFKAMDCRPFTSGRDIDREHSDIRSNVHIAPIVRIPNRFVIVASSR